MASAFVRTKREKTAPAGQSGPGNQGGTAATYYATTYDFASRTFQITPGPDHLIRDDEIRGVDQPASALKNLFNPTWSMTTRAYPAATAYALAATLGTGANYTFTAGNGVITDQTSTAIPTGAYRHVWTQPFANGIGSANPPTTEMDIGYVDQSTYFDVRGAAVNTLTFENTDDDATNVTLEGPCTYGNRQGAPGGSTVLDTAAVVFSKANLSIGAWLASSGATANATTTCTRNVEAPRNIGDVATDGWPPTVEWTNDPVSTLWTIALEKRFLTDADITALLAATGFAARMTWTTGTNYITGTYPHKLSVVLSNAQYTEGTPEELGNKRRHGATYTVRGSSADGTTPAATIEVVTNVSASYNT